MKEDSLDTMTREEVHLGTLDMAHDSISDVPVMNGANKNPLMDSDKPLDMHRATNTTVKKKSNSVGFITSSNKVPNTHNGTTLQSKTSQINHSSTATPAQPLSTIAILRRHTMYDSLILVKQEKPGLSGYWLGLPSSDTINVKQNTGQRSNECSKTKLVTVYLDGDDPIYQRQEENNKKCRSKDEGEIVYVPMNGLLDRLDNYERRGVTIDSRIYAFAMGLNTAERFLTNSSMKEVQEAPPI